VLIALLAVLGVDLIVIVGLVAIVVGRRVWLKKQPGEFIGAIRVANGEIKGLKPKWKRGSGRWVSDVLVWSKAPFMFRNELIPVDRVVGEREPKAGEVKRLGDKPAVIKFACDESAIEVAVREGDRSLVADPLTALRTPVNAGAVDD
jgi:Protein of unknown function (DUF2550)